MASGGRELSRVVNRFVGALRGSSRPLWTMPAAALGFWIVRVPGMRPRAPKRNVLVSLVYLYALVVLVSIGVI
ncbi:hypothetical protein EI982_08030 [Haloplanus rallus]|jgi:hypothetical protein|uniref:Uncharacterized protein n=1 Tax=Haloplanus rallus TaxID=1816183 RepID=A0A6B9F398_9EURY|nr:MULTISPECIES: hypothetical protein [Haloplanus]QGX94748.1 hypothetical protein EI982_08030 [Haloplanus rallus]